MNYYLDKFWLDNKVSFIVGGLGLIGYEISRAFSMAGSKIVILDIDDAKGRQIIDEIRQNGSVANYEHLNVSDMKNLESNFSEITKKYNTVDIFVNCSYPRTDDWASNSFAEISLESLRKNVDIHMNSYLWLSKEVANTMIEQRIRGSIINFSSTYGVVGQDLTVYEGTDMQENMTYAAIKGGVVNFSRLMASYYGRYGIRVNCLCPGGVFDNQKKTFIENYSRKTPLKRMGKPEEIASATLFLASDASSYITGSAIMVDGGWTTM